VGGSQPSKLLRRLGCRRDPHSKLYRAPSEPTIRRVLQGIDAEQVDCALAGWLCSLGGGQGEAVAINGKTLRGAQRENGNHRFIYADAFPSRAVGSVVGFGGMCGGIGGMLMLLVAGGMLQWLGNFTPLFILAGVMHPLAWIAIRALVGKNIMQIDLDKGLRIAQSPALLAMGLGLVAVGATLAALVFAKMEGSLRSFPSVFESLSLIDCAVYARHD
jgi:hypothetical protein